MAVALLGRSAQDCAFRSSASRTQLGTDGDLTVWRNRGDDKRFRAALRANR